MSLLDINFCSGTASLWKLIGNILFIFKIVVPLLVIVFGIIDLGKAVVASKDDEIKKAMKSLAMRFLAAAVIFFIPQLVSFLFTIVDGFSGVSNDFDVCKTCITSPGSCNTGTEDTKEGK